MTVRYASKTATGANNGTSWADAYTDLQAALNAVQNGDTLHLDAPESNPWRGGFSLNSRQDWLITTDQGPSGETWLRGGRVFSDWQQSGAVFSRTMLEPSRVTWDFKRDDAAGTVTGVDLGVPRAAQWLPQFGRTAAECVQWYGFLYRAPVATATPADGEWSYLNGVLHVNPPGSPTAGEFAAKCEVPVRSINALLVASCSNFEIDGKGLTGILYPDRGGNSGYVVEINAGSGGTINGGRGIAVGWHGFGTAGASTTNNTLENLLVIGQMVEDGGGAVANPFVIAGDAAAANGNVNGLGRNLVSIAAPLARYDGKPILNAEGAWTATLGLGHNTQEGTTNPYYPLRWDRCLMLDFGDHACNKFGIVRNGNGGRMLSSGQVVGNRYSLAGWGQTITDSRAWGAFGNPSGQVGEQRVYL